MEVLLLVFPQRQGREEAALPLLGHSLAPPCLALREVEWDGFPGKSDGGHQLLSSDHVPVAPGL